MAPRRRRRTFRRLLVTLVVLAVLAAAVVGAVAGIRSVYFVGQDDRGLVTLYRGVPYELPFGIDLYETQYVSSVPARTLSATQRRRLLDHQLRSREDAADDRARPGAGQAVSARNRELLGLFPVAMLITAGFTGVYAARSADLGSASLTYGAIFLGLCLGVHLFIRATLPNADPYLFPLVALLAAFGLVMIYRIDEALARQQAGWFVAGHRAVRRHGAVAARRARAGALPVRDRRGGHRPAAAAAGCPGSARR